MGTSPSCGRRCERRVLPTLISPSGERGHLHMGGAKGSLAFGCVRNNPNGERCHLFSPPSIVSNNTPTASMLSGVGGGTRLFTAATLHSISFTTFFDFRDVSACTAANESQSPASGWRSFSALSFDRRRRLLTGGGGLCTYDGFQSAAERRHSPGPSYSHL